MSETEVVTQILRRELVKTFGLPEVPSEDFTHLAEQILDTVHAFYAEKCATEDDE